MSAPSEQQHALLLRVMLRSFQEMHADHAVERLEAVHVGWNQQKGRCR